MLYTKRFWKNIYWYNLNCCKQTSTSYAFKNNVINGKSQQHSKMIIHVYPGKNRYFDAHILRLFRKQKIFDCITITNLPKKAIYLPWWYIIVCPFGNFSAVLSGFHLRIRDFSLSPWLGHKQAVWTFQSLKCLRLP